MKIASFIFLFTFYLSAQWGGNSSPRWGGNSAPAWGGNPADDAPACEWIVTNTNDAGAGTLRQMIADASAGDTICFDESLASERITLSSFLTIDKDLSIFGFGTVADRVIISGADDHPIFRCGTNGVDLVLRGLKITRGDTTNTTGTAHGGGVFFSSNGTLTLDSCTVDSCQASNAGISTFGGGIYANSATSVIIRDCIIADNDATNSGGVAQSRGGGIAVDGVLVLRIERTAVIRNTVTNSGTNQSFGGGLEVRSTSGTVKTLIINSTFSGNTCYRTGAGGIDYTDTMIVDFCTVNANTSGTGGTGNIRTASGVDTIRNTIVANGTGSSVNDISGTIGYVAESLIENVTGLTITSDGGGNITATDPGLAALAFDGETWIHAIDSGDPVYNVGDCDIGTGGDVDQRGVSRPQSTECDMGAYELE